MTAKKDQTHAHPVTSNDVNFEILKAHGLSAVEVDELQRVGFDWTKILAFIQGLLKLLQDTGIIGGDGGGVFGAQRTSNTEAEKLKQMGASDDVAKLGLANIVMIIKFIISLLGGLGGVVPGTQATPRTGAADKK